MLLVLKNWSLAILDICVKHAPLEVKFVKLNSDIGPFPLR